MDAPTPISTATLERRLRTDSDGLRALALRLLGNSADADDCVQEAALRALESPSPRSPRAWLRTVVRRLAFRRGRDRTRRRRRELLAARPEAVQSALDAAEAIEVRRRLLAAVAALDEPGRSAVVMRYLEGRTPTEIATLVGAPVKSVKTRLSRALARLRARLDESHGGRRSAWTAALLPIASPEPRWTTPAAAAAGGLLVMKKLAVVAALLLLLVGGGVLVVGPLLTAQPTPERAPDAASAAPDSRLAAAPAKPTRVAAPATPAPSTLRAGDAVPSTTFAGRVVDPEGNGVVGATVRLFWHGSTPRSGEPINGSHLILRRERERHEGPVTSTDGDGYFRFDRPYASYALLRAEARGFAPTLSGRQESGAFLVVRLVRERSARVTVLTEAGAPVADAEVRLTTPWRFGTGMTREVVAVERTDLSGVAMLPTRSGGLRLEAVPREADLGIVERDLQPEESAVEVRVSSEKAIEVRVLDADSGLAAAGAWVDVLRVFDFGSPENEPARRRFLANRDGVVRFPRQKGYESALASAPGYEVSRAYEDPVRLTRAMTIEGTVVSHDGTPVEGAALLVAIPGDFGLVFDAIYSGLPGAAAWTDAQGRFELEVKLAKPVHGVPPPDRGARSILAVHPDFAAAVEDGIRVEPGRHARLALRFPRPGSLAATVVDADGAPVKGAWLQLSRAIPTPQGWPPPRGFSGIDTVGLVRFQGAMSDESGRAVIGMLPPGRHLVRAGTLKAEVEIREGEQAKLRLVKGAGPQITGLVLDASGAPLAGRQVSLSGPDAASASTDAQGRFRFEDLSLGDYSIWLQWLKRQPYTVAAKPGDDVRIRLPAGYATLRIAVDGPPPGSWEYSLVTVPGGCAPEETGFAPGAAGIFETPGFTPGVGVVVVRAKGFGWTAARFESSENAATDVRLALSPSGAVSGRVGEPALGRRGLVRLRRLDGFPESVIGDSERLRYAISRSKGDIHDHAPTAVDGEFRIEDVSAGPYELSYGRYESGATWTSLGSVRVEVPSGGSVRADLAR